VLHNGSVFVVVGSAMTNPLQFIDDIFTGIVQFIFNIADSLRILIGNPSHGTLRLAARYKHNKSPQISYITILFLLNSVSYLLYLSFNLPSQDFFSAVANSIFQNLRGNGVTNVLIYATAATALQQLWIASQTSKKVNLSEPEVASLKLGYLFSSCAAIWLLFQTASFAALHLVNRFRVSSDIAGNIMVIGPFVLGLLFIGFISYKGRRLAPRKIQSGIAVLLPLTLIFIQLSSYIFPSVFELAKGTRIQITALSCKLSNSSYLDVDAVVANLTDTTLILKRSDITIRGNGRDRDGKLYTQTSIHVDDYGELALEVDRNIPEYTILDRFEFAAIDGDARRRQKPHLATEFDEPRTRPCVAPGHCLCGSLRSSCDQVRADPKAT
jgi:hypothetical protein